MEEEKKEVEKNTIEVDKAKFEVIYGVFDMFASGHDLKDIQEYIDCNTKDGEFKTERQIFTKEGFKDDRVTKNVNFTTLTGKLQTFKTDLTPFGNVYEEEDKLIPTVTAVLGKNIKEYQRGLFHLIIKDGEYEGDHIIHIDGIMTGIYNAYELKNPYVIKESEEKAVVKEYEDNLKGVEEEAKAEEAIIIKENEDEK
ncbi:MAG: hypothetical protein RBR14_05660 [Candidatus Cloacimonas acidaminovorans]|nr:hypothetical protein [Candidatus Cloacimonas acidaminovorans]